MARLKCEYCGTTFDGRADAKYCGGPHRAAAAKERRQSRRQAQQGASGRRSTVLTSAFTRSIKKTSRLPADGTIVALARVYAKRIDANPDELRQLGPQLLNILDHMRMTPKAREARKGTSMAFDPGSSGEAGKTEAAVREFVASLKYGTDDPRTILGQVAIDVARRVDESDSSAAAVRELRVLLSQLEESPAPAAASGADQPADGVDEIRKRRAERLLDQQLGT